jgi:RNA polymerase sigma-B factor
MTGERDRVFSSIHKRQHGRLMSENQSADSKLVEYRRTRDRALRDQIVAAHLGLAYSIARRFERRGEERDDLRQVALMALVRAVERFDPSRGLTFPTFAAPTISGTLKKHLRDKTWLVRPPRRLNERSLEAVAVREQLTATLGRLPTFDEVGTAGGWSRDEVEEAIVVATTHRLYAREALGSGDVSETLEIADEFKRVTDRLTLIGLLKELNPRERQIVGLRYLNDMTQREIADQFGVSPMRVSRLLSRSMDIMRKTARQRKLSTTA